MDLRGTRTGAMTLWSAVLHRPLLQDGLVAAVVAALSVAALWSPPPFVDYDFREADALGVVLALAAALAVALRSRLPVVSSLGALAAVVPLSQLGYSQTVGGVAVLLTLYSLAVHRPWRTSAAVLALDTALVGLVLVGGPFAATASEWLANLFVLVLAWGLGRSVRGRRAHLATLAARNRAEADARAAETRALVVEERARVARELQDLVAHTLTETSVQVAAARRTMRGGDVDAAEQLMLAAEDAGRSAMTEIRRVAQVLGHADGAQDFRPQPGLGDLPELVDRERAAGVEVVLRTTGAAAVVPSGVALTTYRLVEEALADARAQGSAAVAVDVAWSVDTLSVQVRTTPRPGTARWHDPEDERPGGPGRLRTRVELYGGRLRVAATRDGGVEVTARFPITARRTA